MTVADLPIENARLLVTGGTGFLGSAFIRHSVRAGASVTALIRRRADAWRLATVRGEYHAAEGDLLDLPSISAEELGNPQVLIHFAAAGVSQLTDDLPELIDTNVLGTIRALQAASRVGVRRFVLIGTSGEYGPGAKIGEDLPPRPNSAYGITRAAATRLCLAMGQELGLEIVVMRPFAVYGPFEAAPRLIPYCVRQSLAGKDIRISSGVQTRDYVFVDDVSDAVLRGCVAPAASGSILNVCTGVETSVEEVARLVAALGGKGATVIAGAREHLHDEMWRSVGNPTRISDLLGWRARTSLESGLVQTIQWFQESGLALPAYREREGSDDTT